LREERLRNPQLAQAKGRLWKAQPAFSCLKDPDQQNDDQNDQENGAKSDVHAPPSFRSRLIFSGGFVPQTSPNGSKREENGLSPRLEAMSARFLLRMTFAALVVVALLSALAQLAVGRRPVLLGGQTV
jgi:hypothetical protein